MAYFKINILLITAIFLTTSFAHSQPKTLKDSKRPPKVILAKPSTPLELNVRFKEKNTQFKIQGAQGKFKLLHTNPNSQKSMDLKTKDLKYIFKQARGLQKKVFTGDCELGEISLIKNNKLMNRSCITAKDASSLKLKKFANLMALAGTAAR